MATHVATIGFDFDAMSGFISRGLTSPTPISRGEFGPVAVPRILALLKKYKVRSSWFVPGHTLETYPAECRMIFDAGHEIGHHGWTHMPPNDMTREQEEGGLVRANEGNPQADRAVRPRLPLAVVGPVTALRGVAAEARFLLREQHDG